MKQDGRQRGTAQTYSKAAIGRIYSPDRWDEQWQLELFLTEVGITVGIINVGEIGARTIQARLAVGASKECQQQDALPFLHRCGEGWGWGWGRVKLPLQSIFGFFVKIRGEYFKKLLENSVTRTPD